MTNDMMESDNWGQLLSDFGIDDHKQEESLLPEAPAELPKKNKPAEVADVPAKHRETPSTLDDFGAGLIDSPTAAESEQDESARAKEKKSIFSRFAKVSFFGTPPQVSLESVIEGVKSPSLSGKGFTNNTLEKMPLSQERSRRQKKQTKEEPNTWSLVASQIETLASGEEPAAKREERSVKRHISSMFDDPIPESEETRALKNLMGESAPADRKHRNAFLEEESGSRRRDRGRQPSPAEDRAPRGRGARYTPPVEVDDVPESDFEPLEENPRESRGRGGRGSRYAGGRNRYDQGRVQDNEPQNSESQEEWSEIDAALQADQEKPAPRGDRYRRDRDRRPERSRKPAAEREPLELEEDERDVAVLYGNVPSWDDAIADIVLGNVSRHRNFSGRGRR